MRVEEVEVDVLICFPRLHQAVLPDVFAGRRDVGLVTIAHVVTSIFVACKCAGWFILASRLASTTRFASRTS